MPGTYHDLASVQDSWPEGLLILMYHAIAVPPLLHGYRGLYVPPPLLARQLRELAAARPGPFTSLTQWNAEPTARPQVAVTFDDGFRNLLDNAVPILQETGVRGLTYVLASLIGKSNIWDHAGGARHEPLMDRSQLCEWQKAGHEVGSHGLTHRDLTVLPLEEARREVFESKALLEDILGQPVRHFCYPYGGCNEAVRDLVEEAGYVSATTTRTGLNFPATDRFLLRRHAVAHRRPWLAAVLGR